MMGRRGGEHILQPLASRKGCHPSFFPSSCLLQPQPSCPPLGRDLTVIFQQPYVAVPGRFGLAASQRCCSPPPCLPDTCCLMPSATTNTRGKAFFLILSGERHRGSIKRVTLSQKTPHPGQGRTVSSRLPEEPGRAQSSACTAQQPEQDAGPQHWGHTAHTATQADLTAILENIADHIL